MYVRRVCFVSLCHLIHICTKHLFNPQSAGGWGAPDAPLPIFFNNSQTRWDIITKLSVPLPTSISYLSAKKKNSQMSQQVIRIRGQREVTSYDFGSKNMAWRKRLPKINEVRQKLDWGVKQRQIGSITKLSQIFKISIFFKIWSKFLPIFYLLWQKWSKFFS